MGTGQLLAVPRLSLCSSTTMELSLLTFLPKQSRQLWIYV